MNFISCQNESVFTEILVAVVVNIAWGFVETGITKEALRTLQTLNLQPNDYPYYEQTRWYLTLVHLKLHHKAEAKKYLDELVKLEGVYLDKAKELIHKIG